MYFFKVHSHFKTDPFMAVKKTIYPILGIAQMERNTEETVFTE
jgi:hypothetical protein